MSDHTTTRRSASHGIALLPGAGGQPTTTIQALALRAGGHIPGFAKRNEIQA